MFLCSIYVQNLQQALYVFRKFCVLCCLVLFTFTFNIFVTNESMYIVMMREKKKSMCQDFCTEHPDVTISYVYYYKKV